MSSNEIEGTTRLMWIIFLILQQLVAIIVAYVISISFDGFLDQLWLWHKVLTPIGVVLIMFEGVLAFSPHNHITSDFKKSTQSNIHGMFMSIGITLMTIGIVFAFATNTDGHFISLHGVIGFIAWILCLIAYLGGILTRFPISLGIKIRLLYLRFCHTFIGLSAFLLSFLAVGLGLHKLIEEKPIGVPIIVTLLALVGITILLTSGRTVLKHTITAITS